MKKINSRRVGAASALSLAMIFAGGAVRAEQTIQGNQNSDGAASTSGNANGNNTNNFDAGTNASGTNATSTQNGKNSGSSTQSGNAKGGDAVAGGQVVGAVGDDVTVQVTNNADDPDATSGLAEVRNVLNSFVGAQATATTDSVATQNGDNDFDFTQDATGSSGDAVGGSQVVGIVGDGEHTVQANNTADCSVPAPESLAPLATGECATSGNLELHNHANSVHVGAFSTGAGDADVTQSGSNGLAGAQDMSGGTGDALYGSQVSGIVGGSATAQLNNASDCVTLTGGCSGSGVANLHNQVGSTYFGTGAVAGASATADAQQVGDNSTDLTQTADGFSGDALSGSQVSGAVGSGGFFTGQFNNTSDGDTAESGLVDVDNEVEDQIYAATFAGQSTGLANATQSGDNSVTLAQDANGDSGDALAGGQVSGTVGHDEITIQGTNNADDADAVSGDSTVFNGFDNAALIVGTGANSTQDDATATQNGSNAFDATQTVSGSTGDAVAAAQIAGAVGGDEVTIQNTNSGDGDAETGALDLDNELDGSFPLTVGAFADGSVTSTATQNGDNAAAVAQTLEGSSGDAVAGSQVTGVAGNSGTTATVQVNNTADGDSTSGLVDADNDIDLLVGAGTWSTVDAFVTQSGDNAADFAQDINVDSGDAVAAAQISGLVAGDATLQANNAPDGSGNDAVSGNVDGYNDLDAFVGASTLGSVSGDATVTSNGDSDLVFAQNVDAGSGDAVSASQVSGVVATDSTVQTTNDSDNDSATSGTANGTNDADGNVGPFGDADGAAVVTGNGDATSAGDQTLDTPTGDAVAGAQVTGKA